MHPGFVNPVPILSGLELDVGGVSSSGEFRTFMPTQGHLKSLSES